MEHTPGPWIVGIKLDGYGWPTYRIRDMKHPRGESGYAEEVAANAHLIAAAPELLEACRAALAELHKANPYDRRDVRFPSEAEQAISQAIHKATGGE